MLRQYNAQRRRGGFNPFGVGTINLGDTIYLQDGVRPLSGWRGISCRREPCVVVGFHNREYCYADGSGRISRMVGGHMVEVKSLRSGRTAQVADWLVLWCLETGHHRELGTSTPIPTNGRVQVEYVAPKRRRSRRAMAA
jgi:hypothetical protein